MIDKGSLDEQITRQHIAEWRGLIAHWNKLADGYRQAARGRSPASDELLEESDETRAEIQGALELSDRLIGEFPVAHELRRDLFQISAALESLSESIAISAERMVPRIEDRQNIAGLKFLLGALKRDAGLDSDAKLNRSLRAY